MRTLSAANKAAIASKVPWIIDFVKITVDPNNSSTILRMSTHFHNITFNSEEYIASAPLLAVGKIDQNIKATDDSIDIQLSGVSGAITAIVLGNPIAGSLVEVSRGYYDEETGDLVDDPIVQWNGRINDFNIIDEYENSAEDTITLTVSCKSLLNTILDRVAGRFTSPESYDYHNSGDKSMEYVSATAGFNPLFGKED